MIAAVDPSQQNEFVGMSAEQLLQLDLNFLPGEDVEEKPLAETAVCPDGDQGADLFAALAPAAVEGQQDPTVASADESPLDLQQVDPAREQAANCLGDLTELSLLELMNVRVEAEPTPDLPQLQPVDLDSLFDTEDDDQSDNNVEPLDDSHEDTFVPPTPIAPGSTPPFNVDPVARADK
ncbi:MAG TPA: hypothetical protein VH835_00560, partial [Dongiaceae bacterium]